MHNNIKNEQSGMVAILVTLIMMIVIALVVLGFSQLSSNDTTQALNHELSLEAFYAADSGLNNAVAAIQHDVNTNEPIAPQTNHCTTPNPNYESSATYNNNGTANAVAYTCVTVNPAPIQLSGQVGPNAASLAEVFPIQPSSNLTVPVQSITFSWDSNPNETNFNCTNPVSVGELPSAADWECDPGLLQIDLIPASYLTSPTSQTPLFNEETETSSFFLYPTSTTLDNGQSSQCNPGVSNQGSTDPTYCLPITNQSQGAATLAPPTNSAVYQARCTLSTNLCSATIVLPAAYAGNLVYARVTSEYNEDYVYLSANNDSPLYQAEAEIDSTGKAQNVLQRLVEDVPFNSAVTVPFALQSGDGICKLIEGYPAVGTVPGESDFDTNILPSGTPQDDAKKSCSF
jgi:hypothetical protein